MSRASATELHEASWWAFERHPGETLRAALERNLRDAILSGALREGVQLPASRTLAHELGVSRGVISDAYGQLESQGFLITRVRAAPVVAAAARASVPPPPSQPAPRPPRWDLTPTTPDVSLFPLRRWLAVGERVAREATSAMLDYGEPHGERVLREALADHLGRTRGVIAGPGQILVNQGTAHGTDLLLRVLRARGARRVAVEDPSHTTQHERIQAMGLTLAPQPTDGHGLVVEGLVADAVLVTPAHQFPTGSVLSGERRRELLAWARDTGGLIVEDDYDAVFRYDKEPVRALQGLAPDHVVQLGTVSKTLAPALRLGWLVAPPALIEALALQRRLVDDFSPVLEQLTLAEFLRRGDYDRHVRAARAVYRARRDRLLTALAKHVPGLAVAGVAAGMHVVLRLPDWADDAAISARAWEARIRVPALSSFCVAQPEQRGLVIGYGRLHESSVAAAVRALATILRQFGAA
ncbi:MAG: PLP-dependent aminotransferase family protein [Solirubrobacteraceae bacterium]